MMLDLISVGDYYAPVEEESDLRDLRDEVNSLCRERFRRIDRFTQLCLLGSARCVGNANVDSRTGLYIGSRFSPMSNTIKVQEQIFLKGQVPKPANFINTLSNSAGFYVARNLGLEGENIFVSRADASLEAALQIASLDIERGNVDQALIGVVDECVFPIAHHCLRMGVPRDTSLGEGSHWFLIRPGSATDRLASITDARMYNDERCLQNWLANKLEEYGDTLIHGSFDTTIPDFIRNMGLTVYNPKLNYYPSRTAGTSLRFVKENPKKALITLHVDECKRFHVTHTIVGY